MASLSPLTEIPVTQPTCGPLSLSNPAPQCPSTTNNNGSSEAMGCFVQSTGFYCAPISTTRGFLYSLDNSTTGTADGTSSDHIVLIPQLSIPTAKDTNRTGVDGLPVRTQGPARLGQSCVTIPEPNAGTEATTLALWELLRTMANQRLNETVGFPGLGSGPEVLSLRGDCEPGAYCSGKGAAAVCKEQLPTYHACSSYFECISLRCEDSESQPAKAIGRISGIDSNDNAKYNNIVHPLTTTTTTTTATRSSSSLQKRRVGAVCLPPKHERSPGTGTGSHTGNGNNEGSSSPKFPAWSAVLVALVIVAGAALAFILVRRRKRREVQKNNDNSNHINHNSNIFGGRSSAEREREHHEKAKRDSDNEKKNSNKTSDGVGYLAENQRSMTDGSGSTAVESTASSRVGKWFSKSSSRSDKTDSRRPSAQQEKEKHLEDSLPPRPSWTPSTTSTAILSSSSSLSRASTNSRDSVILELGNVDQEEQHGHATARSLNEKSLSVTRTLPSIVIPEITATTVPDLDIVSDLIPDRLSPSSPYSHASPPSPSSSLSSGSPTPLPSPLLSASASSSSSSSKTGSKSSSSSSSKNPGGLTLPQLGRFHEGESLRISPAASSSSSSSKLSPSSPSTSSSSSTSSPRSSLFRLSSGTTLIPPPSPISPISPISPVSPISPATNSSTAGGIGPLTGSRLSSRSAARKI